MKIVINSHIKSEIALNHLLESMKIQSEFKSHNIIIIIGGYYDNYTEYHIEYDENITYIKSRHNSIDFTGLITLLDLYSKNEDEYYLYLHDTTKVGNNFFTKLESINLTNVSSIKIKKDFSMNIGIYSQKIINQFKDFLLSMKNNDERKCLEFKNINISLEDYIFNNDNNNIILDDYNDIHASKPIDYYNTGVIRIIEYYPNLDLYKMKSWYFYNDTTLISNLKN